MGVRHGQSRPAALLRRVVLAGTLIVLGNLVLLAPPSSAATADPLGDLGQAKTIVVALKSRTHDPHAVKLLHAAAEALAGAANPSLWVDPSHVVAPSYGETMFRDTLAAMDDLQGLSSSALPQARALILEAERGVARATIVEAAGGDAGALARAQDELHAGDVASFGGHASSALDDYSHAWSDAFAAVASLANAAVTSIPPAELAADAEAAIASPTLAVFSPSLVENPTLLEREGRPVVFFLGYEFCPYCATESWGLIAALSQFGTFHNLRLISSDPRDGFSVSGFTFRNASYSSKVLDLETIEQFSSVPDPNAHGFDFPYQPLQQPTRDEQQLITTFDTFGGAPFIDIGNGYTTLGATVNIEDLRGVNWAQILAALRDPKTVPAQAIAATTETITAELCEATDEHPASVCRNSVVQQFRAVLDGATGGGFCPGAAAGATASRVVRRRTKPARRVRLFHGGTKPHAHAARCSV